jgi:O-antigen ligase
VGLGADRRDDIGKIPWGAGQGLHFPEWHFSYLRLRAHRRGLRLLARTQEGDCPLALLAALFIADIAFVAASRTVLLVAPLLVIALGYRQFGLKGVLAAALIAGALAGALWLESSYLRTRIADSMAELRGYLDANTASSTGEHLEFLKKSWRIVADAPVIGHGTGSIAEEFRRARTGETGAASVAPVNPHNQIFAVAIQLGLLGVACCWRCGRRISCCSAAPASSPGSA